MSEKSLTSKTLILSTLNISSRNFNPLASLPVFLIQSIKKDGNTFQGCLNFCDKLWKAMRKNDLYSKGQISLGVLQDIWSTLAQEFQMLTNIKSVKQIMDVFDKDRDGYLNEDEQLLIFSFIKQRMYDTAQNLLKIQQYALFKTLMKDVRLLQKRLSEWQKYLRNKIHNRQLSIYRSIGDNRIDQFALKYQVQFKKLQQIKAQRRKKLQQNFQNQLVVLQQQLSSKKQLVKFKPKNKLFDLQKQQKLVSLQQRVQQALDFRKQLKQMQKKEAERVDLAITQNNYKSKTKIQKKFQRQKQQLQLILEQMEHKLLIKMRNQYDITLKKKFLHQNQIKRIQSSQANWALKQGMFKPQLQRTKQLQRQRNRILQQAKRTSSIATSRQSTNAQKLQSFHSIKTKTISNKLNQMVKRGTLFNYQLRTKTEIDQPVNIKIISRKKGQIDKYLNRSNNQQDSLPSLCQLYTEDLVKVDVNAMQQQIAFSKRKEQMKANLISKITTQ